MYTNQPTDKTAITTEALTPCCNAPFYAKTIRIGTDGQTAQDGTPTEVRGCMSCGNNYPVEKKRFEISDELSANWFLKKLGNIRAEQARVKAQAEARAQELEADYTRLMHLYGQQLETFARTEATRRRRKTITLQQGTIALRTVPARLVIEDIATAETTARAVCPAAIVTETVTRFDREAFLQHAKTTMEASGEILPGIKKTESTESFSIKFGTAE